MTNQPRQPAEWEPVNRLWTAWPAQQLYWQEPIPLSPFTAQGKRDRSATAASFDRASDAFTCARAAVVQMLAALAPEQPLGLLVANEEAEATAQAAIEDATQTGLFHQADLRIERLAYGDIWLRDSAPIVTLDKDTGRAQAQTFLFNGWGGKYQMPGDEDLAPRLADRWQIPSRQHPIILEGGAIESDGNGTLLTTRQCLLNRNRNPQLDATDLDKLLQHALGCEKILWLDEGLRHDHTDGHIDNLARFIGPTHVLTQEAASPDDPNRDIYRQTWRLLERMSDAAGHRLEVSVIPSPGLVCNPDGQPVPASHLNFIIGHRSVIVPVYGTPFEAAALEQLAALFPGRRVIGIPANALLSGGGAFHCITQPVFSEIRG